MVMTVIYFLGGLDHLSDHVIALHPSSCVMRCPSIIKQFYFLREEVFDKSICICETVTSPAGPNMQTGYFGKKKNSHPTHMGEKIHCTYTVCP